MMHKVTRRIESRYRSMNNSIGFIILRHVQNNNHNKLWTHSYDSIRKYYPETEIIIIDDNSNQEVLENKNLINTNIINSEFPKRAELLPYVYFLKNKWFDNAVIIHDAIFINSKINFDIDDYQFFWTFKHTFNNPVKEKSILAKMKNGKDLVNLYNKPNDWSGCFGAISVVNHNYLKEVNTQFCFSDLIPLINTRSDRMYFERILGCMMNYNNKKNSIFGDINNYCPWGMKYEQAIKYTHLPVIKVWNSRE